jgi:hypothetical protein
VLAFRIITLIANCLLLLLMLVGLLVTVAEGNRDEEAVAGIRIGSCLILPVILLTIIYIAVEIFRGSKQTLPPFTPTYPDQFDYWSPRRQRDRDPGED